MEEFFSTFEIPKVDVSIVNAKFAKTSALMAMSAKYESISYTPSAAGMMVGRVFGTSKIFLIRACHLQKLPEAIMGASAATAPSKPSKVNLKEAVEVWRKVTSSQMQELNGKDIKIYEMELEKKDLLWVPAGYVVAEKSSTDDRKGAGTWTSIRKSFFNKGEDAAADIEALAGMMKNQASLAGAAEMLGRIAALYRA
eukprot:6466613-Amphidinium_carterae.2